jgi:hypothetical protein
MGDTSRGLCDTVGVIPHWRKGHGLIVTFGDSGSLQHNCDERVEGDILENPYQSMEKQGFLS